MDRARFGDTTGDRSSERRETDDGFHQEKLYSEYREGCAVALIVDGGHTIVEVVRLKFEISETSIRNGEEDSTAIGTRLEKQSLTGAQGRAWPGFAENAKLEMQLEFATKFRPGSRKASSAFSLASRLAYPTSTTWYLACAELGCPLRWRSMAEPSARTVRYEALTAEIVAAYQESDGNPGVRRMWAHLSSSRHNAFHRNGAPAHEGR
jgi:hypothetical protein